MGDAVKIQPGMTIVYQDQEIYVTESMIAEGSLSCTTCDVVCETAVMLPGHLFWICEYGHESDIPF